MFDDCEDYVLPGGTERIINIHAAMLAQNRADGQNRQVVAIREGCNNPECITARHVEVLSYHLPSGPAFCRIEHRPEQPLADTGGRGVVYIVTNAPLRVWVDRG